MSSSQARVGGVDEDNVLLLGELYQRILPADSADVELSGELGNGLSRGLIPRDALEALEKSLIPVDRVSLTGGDYWLKIPLESTLGDSEWVVYIYASYIEKIQAYLINQDHTSVLFLSRCIRNPQ